MNLNEIRQSLKNANDEDFKILMTLAIPIAYKELYNEELPLKSLSVLTKISRFEDKWEIWFNIMCPKALDVVKYIDPVIFDRMSGSGMNASSIVKKDYGHGLEKLVIPLDKSIQENEKSKLIDKLNDAPDFPSWMNTFFESLPSFANLVINDKQYLDDLLINFRKEHEDLLSKRINPWMSFNNKDLNLEFSDKVSLDTKINTKYHNLLFNHPFIKINYNYVGSLQIEKMDTSHHSELTKKALPFSESYALLYNQKPPSYLIKEELSKCNVPPAQYINTSSIDF